MTHPTRTEASGSHFGLTSPDLLEKIDKLFACNVGAYIDLPQLRRAHETGVKVSISPYRKTFDGLRSLDAASVRVTLT